MTSALPPPERTPILRPVADFGIMVEFGNQISTRTHQRVLNLDTALKVSNIPGITDIVPAYASLLVEYDPLKIDFGDLSKHLIDHLDRPPQRAQNRNHWRIPVCYDGSYAPDLAMLSDALELSESDIIGYHLSGQYHVYMYGFAPGYAYLGGVPDEINIPRKTEPVQRVPRGSVIIAGQQSLITTLTLPSGWWNIGRSSIVPLQPADSNPFLFDIGDTVEFVRVSEDDFSQLTDAVACGEA